MLTTRPIRRAALALALVAGLGASSGQTSGIPTVDVASLTADALEYARYIELWERNYRQLESLKGARNFGDVFKNPLTRRYFPEEYQEAYRDAEKIGEHAERIRRTRQKYDSCERLTNPDRRASCRSRAVRGAIESARSIDAIALTDERQETIDDLREAINGTEDVKAVAELQARISTEEAAIANEATRVALHAMHARAEADIAEQELAELNAETWSSTAVPAFGRSDDDPGERTVHEPVPLVAQR